MVAKKERRSIMKRIGNLVSTNFGRFSSIYSYKQLYKWFCLKGKYKGKRIFLIANGPSLNITPLYLLKNEYTIVFNRISLMYERLNFKPTFYMISDGLVASNIRDDVNYCVDQSELAFMPDISRGDLVDFRAFIKENHKVMYIFDEPIKFSRHLPFIGFGNTVIYMAFQIIKYLGFTEVYVVGNDMNYIIHQTVDIVKEESKGNRVIQSIRSKEDDDPNHFDPRYFGKGKEYHQPTEDIVQRIFSGLDRIATEYEKDGIKIVNAGYNSSVECFPKRNFYECLGYSQTEIDDIFEDLLRKIGFESINKFLEKVSDENEYWQGERDIVSVPANIATDIVRKKVLDYLPIGPYNDRLYFINRKIINI